MGPRRAADCVWWRRLLGDTLGRATPYLQKNLWLCNTSGHNAWFQPHREPACMGNRSFWFHWWREEFDNCWRQHGDVVLAGQHTRSSATGKVASKEKCARIYIE